MASGVPGPPEPSPRLELNHPIEWLTMEMPCAFAYVTALASVTSESTQMR
jgi:hypothetical protein